MGLADRRLVLLRRMQSAVLRNASAEASGTSRLADVLSTAPPAHPATELGVMSWLHVMFGLLQSASTSDPALFSSMLEYFFTQLQTLEPFALSEQNLPSELHMKGFDAAFEFVRRLWSHSSAQFFLYDSSLLAQSHAFSSPELAYWAGNLACTLLVLVDLYQCSSLGCPA